MLTHIKFIFDDAASCHAFDRFLTDRGYAVDVDQYGKDRDEDYPTLLNHPKGERGEYWCAQVQIRRQGQCFYHLGQDLVDWNYELQRTGT